MAKTNRYDQTWKCGSGNKRLNNRRFRQQTRQAVRFDDYRDLPDYHDYRQFPEKEETVKR